MYKKLQYECFIETDDQNFDVEAWLKQRGWFNPNHVYVSYWADWSGVRGHEVYKVLTDC